MSVSALVLVPSGTQIHPAARSRRRIGFVFSALYIFLMLSVMLWMFGPGLDAWSLLDLFAALGVRLVAREAWTDLAVFLLSGLGCLIAVLWLSIFNPRRRLVLDARGIQYIPAPLGPLALLDPAWELSWSEIETVEQANPAPRHSHPMWRAILRLRTTTGHRSLTPFEWEVRGEPTPFEPFRFTLRAPPRPDWQARLDAHPLVRALAAHGRAPTPYDPGAQPWYQRSVNFGQTAFDLESSPRALALIAVFFSGAIALFLAIFHSPYRYFDALPWWALVLVAAALAPVGWWWLRRGRVPMAESVIVAALAGTGAGALAISGAPFVNAWTDPEAPRHTLFTMRKDGYLEAPGMPRLTPPGFVMYWSHIAPGEGYRFEVQRGALGFWQYDARPLESEFDAFLAFERDEQAAARAHVRRLVVPREEMK